MCRYTIYHTYLQMYMLSTFHVRGFSGGPDSEESACNAGDGGFSPWVGKILQRREWLPTLVFLPGEFWGLAGYSPWDCKELDMTELLTLSLYPYEPVYLYNSFYRGDLPLQMVDKFFARVACLWNPDHFYKPSFKKYII